MWRQILIYALLGLLVHCTPTVTCDPTASNPNCPASNPICDPAGVCRQSCTPSGGCTDPNTTCDVYPTIGLCQPSCTSNADCPTGQLCFQNSISPPSGSNADAANFYVCKMICPNYASTNQKPNFCVSPNVCTLLSQTTSYFCEGPKQQGT